MIALVLMLVPLIGAAAVPALVLIWHPASSLFIAEATAARRLAVEQRRMRKGRR